MTAPALLRAIDDLARREPGRTALVFLRPDGGETRLTRADLQALVEAWASAMRAAGMNPQDRVVIALPNGPDAVGAFLGALRAGAWPAVLPSSIVRGGEAAFVRRMVGLARDVRLRAVIVSEDDRPLLAGPLAAAACGLLTAPSGRVSLPAPRTTPQPALEDVAYIQLSSGTTGRQKGILLTWAAIETHMQDYSRFLRVDPSDVVVSWLPLFHDMGLITGAILPLWNGIPTVLLSPQDWARRPGVMLEAVHRHRGTLAWMPNFAFNHCARGIRERELRGLDLSCLRVLTNGSEMVRPSSLRAFVDRFAAYGLRPEAPTPAYGLAENTMIVSSKRPGEPAVVEWILRPELQTGQRAVSVPQGTDLAWGVVSCGPPVPGVEVRVLDDGGRPLPERRVGEILVRSGYLFRGYLDRPDLTEAALRDGWLRTGDLGYLADGELFITGRIKDLILIGGRNIHPEDLEEAACQATGLRTGRVAAFAVEDEAAGTEKAVLVAEAGGAAQTDGRALEARLRQAVLQECQVALGEVHFVPSGWIEKTTSTKVSRSACREKLLAERGAAGREPRSADGGTPTALSRSRG